jgi:hypothetical protein
VSDEENLLSKVPSHYAAQAILSLPDAQLSVAEVMEAIIDVPGLGRVKITCRTLGARVLERGEGSQGGLISAGISYTQR